MDSRGGKHGNGSITDYAQNELGDIVYVDVETDGEVLAQEDVFGSIEAVKTVSDLFLPASGTVTEFNAALDSAPELVNKDPYGEGWIIKVSLSKPEELDTLLSPAQYREMIGA